MAGTNRLIDVRGGMFKAARERERQFPRDRGVETPISAVWHVVGKPSDLALVQIYAQRLGITISWEPSRSRRPAVEAREKEKAIRESE